MKKKHKVLRMKQISKEDITRVDEQSFYVPSSDPDMKGEPYLVFYSTNKGWLCDCMNFTLNLKDINDIPTHQCKHIKMVIKEFFDKQDNTL